MKRIAAAAALATALVACSAGQANDPATPPSLTSGSPAPTSTTDSTVFPVTVNGSNGELTIDEMPERVVSISPTATEMLFAVGAGDQVVAVDEFSYFPAEAPVTDLSGFTPNVEAIAAFDPDLVFVSDDIDGVVEALTSIDIPTLQLSAFEVTSIDDVYRQIETVGLATGHPTEAQALVTDMRSQIDGLLDRVEPADPPLTYYHELDSTFYTVTSSTFIGYLYSLFGLENIADPADADGSSFGYPQLTEEYILEADPDFVFLTDCCGDTAASVAARPGWGDLVAVRSNSVVVFDDDVSSRWGPRLVEFLRGISRAIEERDPT